MVSGNEMSSCSEFIQNAWRKDLCVNCQRPRGEHIGIQTAHNHVPPEDKRIDSPKPAKRNSVVTRPWANVQSQKEEEDEEAKWNSMCLPDLNDKSVTQEFSTEAKELNGIDDTSFVTESSSSAILKRKTSKKSVKVCVRFLESDPVIIGADGGYENLFLDELEPEVDGQDIKEEMIFTEEEKEFVLQALHNTLWNMENLVEGKHRKITISKEFEDIQLQSLWKPDRFSHVHEPEVTPQQYGTFPLRAKSSKSNFDVFVDHPKLSPLPEIQEFGDVIGSKENVSARRGSSSERDNFMDLSEMKGGIEKKEPVSEPSAGLENNYDDPWEQRFGLDDSEMNLLEEIRGEIDLDSSSAGMAMVDLLNDILAKYSTGTPSDTDSVKNLDNLSETSCDEKVEQNPPTEATEPLLKGSKEKSSELEAKMVTLAASLRKNRGKRYAPRPPSCPPPPEPTASPTKQIRAAQSTEPNFKMVPVGRPITSSPPIKPSPPEEKKLGKNESTESMEAFKLKNDKEKQPKKGITSFFRSILRRGRDSETDLCTSCETIVSSASSSSELSEQENKNSLERRNSGSDRRNSSSKSSPQLKLKVLPSVTRPLSPKPLVERTSSQTLPNEEDKIIVEDKKEMEISPPQDTNSPSATSKSKDANQVSPTKSTDSCSPSKTKEASSGSQRESSDVMPRRPRDTPSVPPPKPPVAIKPKPSQSVQAKTSDESETKVPPSPPKEGPSRTSLADDERVSREARRQIEQEAVRKRAKSPKRTAAPTGPLRSSLPPKSSDHETSSTVMSKSTDARISIGPKGADPKTLSFAKELEMKLSKGDQTKGSELKRPPAPPHPPQPPSPTSKTAAKEEIEKSPIQTDDKISSAGTETEKLDSQNKPVEKIERPVEKIELPKPTGSRKSFLGKLNRKSRPPPPPSVKRTKSITESSIHGDTPHLKKIDVKDISGPVLITDMTSNKVVNRRNTISLGDDSSFLSGGSTSSGSATDRSEMSPRGSLDNLYELITDKAPDPPHMYDPPVEANTQSRLTPPVSSVPVEGYLEPVRSTAIAEPQAALSQSMISVLEDDEKSGEDADAQEFESVDEERRQILASQPIYEEINGYNKEDASYLFSSKSLKVSTSISQSNLDENGDASNIQPPQSPGVVSISSESDVSSACNTLTRPRPVPRRRARRLDGSGFEQYVAMNRPSVAVALNEDQLREILSKLTAMNMHSLREIYTHHEKVLMKECLHLGAAGPLKWQDFDIYGKPIHTSERCVVYNAKMRLGVPPCQVMLLHTRPDMTSANHPSILKPTCIFSDSIPFSYLTDDFIKTSQLLENCVYQSNVAKCYVAVGLFDITESVTDYLAVLEAKVTNQRDFLEKTLFVILQLLSAISHCVEQGHHIAESDFRDIFLISNSKCSGDIVSFLPQQRSQENQQIESVCIFIENFLDDVLTKFEKEHLPSLDPSMDFTLNGMQTIILLLQNRNLECLVNVRSFTEFILWGPRYNDLFYAGEDRQSSIEPRLSMWLEHKRSEIIHSFAKRGVIKGAACYINDFYCMKFLLKSNAMSLSESIRVNAYF